MLHAVSDSLIGIDVERRKRDRLAVARRCFDKKEYEDIRSAHTEQEQDMRFLEYWTMKEAYVKYLGEGLRIPFHSFRIKRMENTLSYLEKDLKTQNVYFATLFLDVIKNWRKSGSIEILFRTFFRKFL